ncbi:MAG: hypothetical protein N2379_04690 [Verrucomicrobiae bacterium]|nr:hypothetical protein [Verrucomicrobiae bacterium]
MKTLAQVESRTPISGAPITITTSGSYYLTTNLSVVAGTAITIATNGVTLDLNGFTISSTAPGALGAYGVLINSGLRDITIRNGHVQGTATNDAQGNFGGGGFAYGISYVGQAPTNALIWRVSVSRCLGDGINLGTLSPTRAEDCVVHVAGASGIVANAVKGYVAMSCGYPGIWGNVVSDCRGQSIGNGSGVCAVNSANNCYGSAINAVGVQAGVAQNCWGISSAGDGVEAIVAMNCHGTSSSGNGITAGATAQNCYGSAGGAGSGVYAVNALNCYGVASGTGVDVYALRTASGCYGSSTSGTGLSAQNAAFCVGNRSGGMAIEAAIADGCYASAGPNLITHKYNMP